MKNLLSKFTLLIVFLFANQIIISQKVKIISLSEFQKNYELLAPVKDYPKNKLPENVSEVYVNIDENNSTAQLIYKLPDSYKFFPPIKVDFQYNRVKQLEPVYTNGLIEISSQLPYSATIVTGFFKIEGNRLIFIKEEVENPADDLEESIDKALKAGNIKEAAELFYDIEYPPADYYENAQKRLLKRAHEIAMNYNKAKEYKKAAETMEYAYSFQDLDCKSTVLSDLKMVRILSDYTYFLEKAKMYNKCIEVANLLVCIKPEFADPYLQLGDSYYHTNQKQKALDTYKTYSKIRIKQGQEKRIPKYVKKRIKELSR